MLLAKIRKTPDGAGMLMGPVAIRGDKAICRKCGKELPEEIVKELGIVKTDKGIAIGVGYKLIIVGNND